MHTVLIALLACVMMASVTQAHPSTRGESETPVPAVVHETSEEHISQNTQDEVQLSPVNELLNAQPHNAGPTKEDWLRLASTEASQSVLIQVLQNPKELLIRRQRALSGLSFFPTDVHKAVVLSILQGDASYRLKGSAAQAYGRMAGKDAVEPLSVLLTSEKTRLREAVVKALIAIEDPSAQEALRTHLPQEKKSYIKNSIQAALQAQPRPAKAEEANHQ